MFRPGDVVMCTVDYEDQFTKNHIYTVKSYEANINYIRLIDDKGDDNAWNAKYFVLLKSNSKSKSRYQDWEHA